MKDAAIEAFDRTIEVIVRPAVKPIWSQMKQNAAASSEQGHGGALIAAALLDLKKRVPNLEVHLIGHSAGSILLGHLLDLLDPKKLDDRVDFAVRARLHGRVRARSLRAGRCNRGLLAKSSLHIHLLSNRRELDDTVGPYQKSLLYLVSRALESDHKMPILGLAKSVQTGQQRQLQRPHHGRPRCRGGRRSGAQAIRTCTYSIRATVSTGPAGKNIKASHGCFDNDAATIEATLARILGTTPPHPVESLEY